MTLEQIIDQLAACAWVYLHQSEDNSWSCTAKLRIHSTGGEFKIHSGFRHPTTSAAAKECLRRVEETVNCASNLKRLGDGHA